MNHHIEKTLLNSGLEVAPLSWKNDPTLGYCALAESYRVEVLMYRGMHHIAYCRHVKLGRFASRDEAVAACQAHFNQETIARLRVRP